MAKQRKSGDKSGAKSGERSGAERPGAQSAEGQESSPGPVGRVKQAVGEAMRKLGGGDADSVNALDLIKAQHRAVDTLFAQIENGKGEAKQAAFVELADLLAIHAAIEEKVFYPAVKIPETEEMLLESVEEHLGMKRVLADLLETDASSDQFDARISVLKELVHHHAIEEEEAKLFPKIRAAVDDEMMQGLASEMIAMIVELQAQGNPRLQVQAETTEAAPI